MEIEELNKYKQPMPLAISKLPIEFIEDHIEDKYGVYETGVFQYKDKTIFINKELGKWHLSVSLTRTIGYYELKEIRYKFMPNNMNVAQIFPPREEFINIHDNCFHLYEL